MSKDRFPAGTVELKLSAFEVTDKYKVYATLGNGIPFPICYIDKAAANGSGNPGDHCKREAEQRIKAALMAIDD
jgi:hypothetical protein